MFSWHKDEGTLVFLDTGWYHLPSQRQNFEIHIVSFEKCHVSADIFDALTP